MDTHVLRITQQMGWVNASSSREGAYEHFKHRIPTDCMMDLHCLLVEHGKVCYECAANGRPQFPPEGGRKNWVWPLVGIKKGNLDVRGSEKLSCFREGSVKIKLENEEQEGGTTGQHIKVETAYV